MAHQLGVSTQSLPAAACFLASRTFKLRAMHPLLLAAALSASNAKPVKAAPPAPSWVFLLETRRQWLLILSDPAPSASANSSNDADGSALESGSGGVASGLPAFNPSPLASVIAPLPATRPEADKSNKSTLIFEGNTLDVPLETDPNAPVPPAPTGPSAPGS